MNMQKGSIAAMAIMAGMSGIPAVSLIMPTVAMAETETGTVGTCPYSYDSDTKTLTIGAGTLPRRNTNEYLSPLPHAKELTSIKFTGDVTLPADSSYMFSYCSGLKSLDLTPLNTENVTDMLCMFAGCSGLKSLDLTPLKTDNVTNMYLMFSGCKSLTNLDLTSFKTDNVTNMCRMFDDCSGLTSLDLAPLKTDNVTDMSYMFAGCSGLKSLDLTPLKTDNVTDMGGMFRGCSGLTSLDLTPLNTENVTNMYGMFSSCSGLKSLDLTPLKTDNVTNMSYMFDDCSGLTSLDLAPLKTDNVTDMSYMFSSCSGLTSLDLTPLKTDNVTNMFNMFWGCSGLTSLRTGNDFGIKVAVSNNKATLPRAMTMDGTAAMAEYADLADGAHYYLAEGAALPDAWKPQHVTYNQKFDSKDSTWSSDSDIHDGKIHLFYSTLGGKWQDPGQDATVDTDNHDHDNGTYLVTIPTKIAYENMNIGKVDTSDSYTVNVRGAIKDGQSVTVTAESGNKLKNGSFEDVTETTTQGKSVWTSDEVFSKLNADGSVAGTDTTDTIKMSGEVKSAGKYEGVVGYSAKLA